MSAFRVNYSYAAPNGALRSGAMIIDAPDADTAQRTTRESLIGKLKYLKVNGATPYDPDQHELALNKKK